MATDWYARRDELESGMVFSSCWGVVRLDRRVAGDGTQWCVDSWDDGYSQGNVIVAPHWSADDVTIEPGDLIDRLPNNYTGAAA